MFWWRAKVHCGGVFGRQLDIKKVCGATDTKTQARTKQDKDTADNTSVTRKRVRFHFFRETELASSTAPSLSLTVYIYQTFGEVVSSNRHAPVPEHSSG